MENLISNDLREALDLLADLVDPDDCHFDHNGACQAHYDFSGNECRHARVKKLLDRHGITWRT